MHVLSLQRLPANLSSVLDSAGDSAAVYVVRLAHVFPTAHSTRGAVTVDLGALFRLLAVQSIEELTADAVAPLADAQAARLRWARQADDVSCGAACVHATVSSAGLEVTLQPMQLRTFRVSLAHA